MLYEVITNQADDDNACFDAGLPISEMQKRYGKYGEYHEIEPGVARDICEMFESPKDKYVKKDDQEIA